MFGGESKYLGRHELGGSAEGARRGAVPHVFLAETVVGNLDVPVERQEDIVELQITVDDAVLVEVLERQAHLGSIEPIQVSTNELIQFNTDVTYCARLRPNCPRWMCNIKSPPLMYSMTK